MNQELEPLEFVAPRDCEFKRTTPLGSTPTRMNVHLRNGTLVKFTPARVATAPGRTTCW